jgi:hypothetical protein
MKIEIEIKKQDIKDLKAVRNYFGEHDKTMFEHKSYAILNILVKNPELSGTEEDVVGKDGAAKSICTEVWKEWQAINGGKDC